MTEQQIAPARANREYSWRPLSFAGDAALAFWTTASSFVEPVEEGGADAAMMIGLRGEGVTEVAGVCCCVDCWMDWWMIEIILGKLESGRSRFDAAWLGFSFRSEGTGS